LLLYRAAGQVSYLHSVLMRCLFRPLRGLR
jgi:hypothetical protein